MDALGKQPVVTVLHVEDNEEDAYFLNRALQRSKFGGRVERVCDGEEAVDYLRGKGQYSNRAKYPLPALVLLDLCMPGRNGLELLRWIRQQEVFKALPVAVLADQPRAGEREAIVALGVVAFWEKPFETRQFGVIALQIVSLLGVTMTGAGGEGNKLRVV